MVTKGYHKNPKVTKEAFVDGWFLTGDVAEMRDGMIYIVDRKKVRDIHLFLTRVESVLTFTGTYQI